MLKFAGSDNRGSRLLYPRGKPGEALSVSLPVGWHLIALGVH